MCDPIFLIIGAVAQGIGGVMQAQSAAQAHRAQQAFAYEQAEQIETAGAYQVKQVMLEAARIGGQQRAAAAESGFDMSGSVADVMEDSADAADMDLQAIMWNTDMSAKNRRTEGSIQGASARSASASAPFAFLSPILGTAAQFPSAFGMS